MQLLFAYLGEKDEIIKQQSIHRVERQNQFNLFVSLFLPMEMIILASMIFSQTL